MTSKQLSQLINNFCEEINKSEVLKENEKHQAKGIFIKEIIEFNVQRNMIKEKGE